MDNDDVIIFEKKHCDGNLELATCEDYFKDLLYRVEVVFIDKTNPNDAGFTLELSQRMSYDQLANAVGQKMNVDPNTIQFFRCQKYAIRLYIIAHMYSQKAFLNSYLVLFSFLSSPVTKKYQAIR